MALSGDPPPPQHTHALAVLSSFPPSYRMDYMQFVAPPPQLPPPLHSSFPPSYRMDYMQFVDHHRATGADISIGCLPVDDARASDFGLMKVDNTGR